MADREPVLRMMASHRDINNNGHIFGGWILSQMDIAGGVLAAERAGGPVATVSVKEMRFHTPMFVRDRVSVFGTVTRVGTTSITVRIEVISRRSESGEDVLITEGDFIFVALNDKGRPRPVDAI